MIRLRFASHLLHLILCSAAIPTLAQEQPQPPVPTVTQSSPSTEAGRIDQLFEQCRTHMRAGRYDDLINAARDALKLSQTIGDKDRVARARYQLGTAYFHQNKTEEAIAEWRESAARAGEAGDLTLQAAGLKIVGVSLTNAGRYDEALGFLTNSLAVARKLPDRKPEAATVMVLGSLYTSQGDYDRGESWLLEALRLAREMNDEMYLDAPLMMLGDLELARGNNQKALDYYHQKLAIETRFKGKLLKVSRAPMRESMATAYSLLGNYDKADEMLRQALEIARADNVSQEATLLSLGMNAYARGRLSEALDWLLSAQSIRRQSEEKPEREWKLSLGLGRVQLALGRKEEALASYRKAIDVVERIRLRSIPSEPAKASVVGSRKEVFTDTIELLASLNRQAEALDVAEQYHARTFLDLLVESKIDTRQDLTKEQREREDKLLARISAVQKELWSEDLPAERAQQLMNDLAAAENDLEFFQLELRRTNARYAGLRYLKPLKVDGIQHELLDKETAVVEYMLGERQSFAWVVSQNGLTMVTLPARKQIEELIEAYRQALTERVSALNLGPELKRVKGLSRQLYEMLVGPVESSLSASQRLVIVPDGALSYLPFETLLQDAKPNPSSSRGTATAPSRYLLERFSISYAPSASALSAIRTINDDSASPPKGLVAFGDPTYARANNNDGGRSSAHPTSTPSVLNFYAERGFDFQPLPYTRKEVAAIGSLFPASERRVYLGTEAREQKVKALRLDGFSFIHFAAHGWVDEQRPMRSGIVLSLDGDPSEDGVLQVGEIMRLKLNADLVTLSACRTGLGKLLNGEGVLGLTRAFFYAGARSVTVSLWNVNDLATAELMNSFYRNLRRGLAKDEALRQAKLAMIKGPNRAHQHPYFWAPFVLIGERK